MRMGMGLYPEQSLRQEPSLRQEQRLELRQKLEQKLEQRLSQQVRLEINLEQYLAQEDIINGFIHWADEHHSWREFNRNGFKFTYAGLPYSVAAPIADVAGMGFAHCRYGLFEGRERGEWTLFIVEDMIPKGLIGPVAIHERGGEISLGNHFFASQLEFAWARWDPKLSLNKYIDWIDKEYPNKFIDLTQKVLFPVLPQELLDFFSREGKRSAQELQKAEDLIRQYPLPDRALKLMERYENETLLFCEAVRYRIGRTQDKLFNMSLKGELTPKKAAEIAHKELRNALLGFTPEEARVISRARAKEVLEVFHNIVGRDAYKFTNRHLNTPVDLGVAYKDAMNRRRLVNVIKTAEDLAREGKST